MLSQPNGELVNGEIADRFAILRDCVFLKYLVWRIRKLGQGSSSSPSIALSAGKHSHRRTECLFLDFFPLVRFEKIARTKLPISHGKKTFLLFCLAGYIAINLPFLVPKFCFFRFLGRFSPSLNEELLHRCLPRPRSLDRSM